MLSYVPKSYRQSGFVLVLALGAVLILTLIVSKLALNIQGLVDIALGVKQREQVIWQSTSARSRVIYSLLTGHKTLHGFSNASVKPRVDDMGGLIQTPLASDLRVDGRWYLMQGFPFAVQDKAGLLAVNYLSEYEFEQLLTGQLQRGLSSQMLAARYQDFIDFDNSKRLMGAENFAYSAQSNKAPINRSLFLAQEITQILGWPDVYMPWEVMHSDQLIWNINTAPKSVLAIKTSASASDIESFIQARETNVYTGVASAEEILGSGTLKQRDEALGIAVSQKLRIAFIEKAICALAKDEQPCSTTLGELRSSGDLRVQLLDIRLTPNADNAPYQIDKYRVTSLNSYLLAISHTFPLSPTVESSNIDNFDALFTAELENISDVPIIEYKNKTIPVR